MADMEAPDPDGISGCWCCGQHQSTLIRLGHHPQVGVCLRCAHDLHHKAVAVEDGRRPSMAARARGVLRRGRRFVTDHDLHQKPLIGPLFRWMGRFMP